MTKKSHQKNLPGVMPPLTKSQSSALTYLGELESLSLVKERAEDRKKDMIEAANKEGVSEIKVRDNLDYTHTFTIVEGDVKITHRKTLETFKAEREPVAA